MATFDVDVALLIAVCAVFALDVLQRSMHAYQDWSKRRDEQPDFDDHARAHRILRCGKCCMRPR